MVYNPYEEEWEAEEDVEKILKRLNLKETTIPSLRKGLKIIAKTDEQIANDLGEAIKDIMESHAARGAVIKDQSELLRNMGVEPQEIL